MALAHFRVGTYISTWVHIYMYSMYCMYVHKHSRLTNMHGHRNLRMHTHHVHTCMHTCAHTYVHTHGLCLKGVPMAFPKLLWYSAVDLLANREFRELPSGPRVTTPTNTCSFVMTWGFCNTTGKSLYTKSIHTKSQCGHSAVTCCHSVTTHAPHEQPPIHCTQIQYV